MIDDSGLPAVQLHTKSLTRQGFLRLAGTGILVVAGAGFLEACSSGAKAPATSGPTKSGAAKFPSQALSNQVPDPTNAYWSLWTAGVTAAAPVFNLAAQTATTNNDVSTQINLMQEEATKGLKLVVLTIADTSIVPQVANIATQNGMWFGNSHSHPAWVMAETLGEQYSVFTTPDNFRMAYELGTSLFTAMGGKGKVINIQGVPGFAAAILRSAGYQAAAAKFPGIEIVASDYGYFNRVQTAPVFQRLFSAHPDVKGVVCASDDSAMGVISVLRSRGAKGILTVGIDAIPEYLAEIKSGQYAHATCTIYGTWNGAWLTARVFDAFHGFKPDPLERMMVTGHTVIDSAASAQAYQKAFLKGAGASSYNPALMSQVLHPKDWKPQNAMRIFVPDEQWPHFQPKPSGFTPPGDWTASANAGNLEKINQEYASRFAALNPASSIGKPVTA